MGSYSHWCYIIIPKLQIFLYSIFIRYNYKTLMFRGTYVQPIVA